MGSPQERASRDESLQEHRREHRGRRPVRPDRAETQRKTRHRRRSMIRASRSGLALALLVAVAPAALAQTQAVGVRDRAGMFSKEAVGEANDALRQVLDKTKWQVAIETVPS